MLNLLISTDQPLCVISFATMLNPVYHWFQSFLSDNSSNSLNSSLWIWTSSVMTTSSGHFRHLCQRHQGPKLLRTYLFKPTRNSRVGPSLILLVSYLTQQHSYHSLWYLRLPLISMLSISAPLIITHLQLCSIYLFSRQVWRSCRDDFTSRC